MGRGLAWVLAAWCAGACSVGTSAGDALADGAAEADAAWESGGFDAENEAPLPGCGNGQRALGEACDGDKVACVDLGAAFASGQAVCRPACDGYDTSGCTPIADPAAWEAVTPALRDPSRWGAARCNDDTPFTFRVRLSPTGSHTWVFALRGGGLCDDNALPCWTRDHALTTTLPEADRQLHVPDDKTGGVFLRDDTRNPAWADANHVFGAYCSSDTWTGVRTERVPILGSDDGWTFAGRLNAGAMLEAVATFYGLDDADPATRVLWAGESAGCVGALVTTDLAARALPRTAAAGRLKVLLDAAWLVSDWDDPEGRLGLAKESDREVVRRAFDLWGGQASDACTSARQAAGGHAGDCLFGAIGLPFLQNAPPAGLGLAVMVQQSLQDEELLTFHGLLDDPEGIAAYAAQSLVELEAVPWLFAADQPYHSTLFKEDLWSLGAPGPTLGEVLAAFWAGEAPLRVISGP